MTTESPIEKSFVRWCKDVLKQWCVKLILVSGSGWPDRAILLPGNRICWIEFKSPTGKTSPVQDFVIREMARYGHKVHVCKSVSEAQQAVKEIMEL